MAEATKYYIGHVDDNLFLKRTVNDLKEKLKFHRQRTTKLLEDAQKEANVDMLSSWEKLFTFAQNEGRCPASFINQNKKQLEITIDAGCVFIKISEHEGNCPLCAMGIPH